MNSASGSGSGPNEGIGAQANDATPVATLPTSHADTLLLEESQSLPPSYEFSVGQTTGSNHPNAAFPPPSLGQLGITLHEARKTLLTANVLWNQRNWASARVQYVTASALFRILQDARNEALSLQRLGEICRIMRDFVAARAHIRQAHVLLGQCGEIARQLMCERSLALVASNEGKIEEARVLLQAALTNSRNAGMHGSEGWCLLRLGELNGTDKSTIQEALDIARQYQIPLLENCVLAVLQRHENAQTTMLGSSRYGRKARTNLIDDNGVIRTDSDSAVDTRRKLGLTRSKSLTLPSKYFTNWLAKKR